MGTRKEPGWPHVKQVTCPQNCLSGPKCLFFGVVFIVIFKSLDICQVTGHVAVRKIPDSFLTQRFVDPDGAAGVDDSRWAGRERWLETNVDSPSPENMALICFFRALHCLAKQIRGRESPLFETILDVKSGLGNTGLCGMPTHLFPEHGPSGYRRGHPVDHSHSMPEVSTVQGYGEKRAAWDLWCCS